MLCLCLTFTHMMYETLRSDMRRKINANIVEEDFGVVMCTDGKPNGQFSCQKGKHGLFMGNDCKFTDEACRSTGTVYSIKCPIDGCSLKYYGSAKREAKKLVAEHLGNKTKLIMKDQSTDSFTAHLRSNGDDWTTFVKNLDQYMDPWMI